jgi:ABC-2 type transport system ATP-binding protein
MPESVKAALQVDHVSHVYGTRRALSDVSFRVAPGSFTVLLGLNGAGKSTLFSLITRLYATRSGNISIFGHDIAANPAAALAQLGVVFQSRALDADISVRQNLAYHAALHGIGMQQALRLSEEALVHVDLLDRINDRVGGLSGGQVRRVEIARALLHKPRLLLLDEATVGLDVHARADILHHVRQLLVREKIGILWATHLMDEALPQDDVVILDKGHVLAHGSVADIVAAEGVPDLAGAFTRLVQSTEAEGAA